MRSGAGGFPFLFGGAFIEAAAGDAAATDPHQFPFLLGRAFIEADQPSRQELLDTHFPSFWEGLSLRRDGEVRRQCRFSGDFPSFWEGLSLRRRYN